MLGLSGKIVVRSIVEAQITITIESHRLVNKTGDETELVLKVSVGAGGTGVPAVVTKSLRNGVSGVGFIADTCRKSSGGRGGPLRGDTRQDGEASGELKKNMRKKKGEEPGA